MFKQLSRECQMTCHHCWKQELKDMGSSTRRLIGGPETGTRLCAGVSEWDSCPLWACFTRSQWSMISLTSMSDDPPSLLKGGVKGRGVIDKKDDGCPETETVWPSSQALVSLQTCVSWLPIYLKKCTGGGGQRIWSTSLLILGMRWTPCRRKTSVSLLETLYMILSCWIGELWHSPTQTDRWNRAKQGWIG